MAKLTFLEVVSAALFMSVVLWQAMSSTAATVPSCNGVTCPSDRFCNMNNFGQPECVCNEVCYRLPDDVCGSDGITYPSQCFFEVAACLIFNSITKVHDGTCNNSKKVFSCDGVTCPPGRFCEMNTVGFPACICDTTCNMDFFDPLEEVCGSDGITYDNQCVFEVAACWTYNSITMVHRGKCNYTASSCSELTCPPKQFCKMNTAGHPECVCDTTCPKEIVPVCGSDGITYGNKCMLDVAACQDNKVITMVSWGQCKTGN